MRTNSLPRLEDLPDGADPYMAARVAELLLRCAVLPRRVTRRVMLGGSTRSVVLDDFPIQDATLDGALPGRQWWVEPQIGVVGSSALPPSSYTLNFQVGQEEGNVPALTCELVRQLCLWRLDGSGAAATLKVVAAGRAARAMLEAARATFRSL